MGWEEITPEEIRKIALDTNYGANNRYQFLLREIAAQLAELNKNVRDIGNVVAGEILEKRK